MISLLHHNFIFLEEFFIVEKEKQKGIYFKVSDKERNLIEQKMVLAGIRKKLPSVQSLKQEYAALLAKNEKLYPDQKKAKAEMMELLTARHNTSRILGLTEEEKRREQRQGTKEER